MATWFFKRPTVSDYLSQTPVYLNEVRKAIGRDPLWTLEAGTSGAFLCMSTDAQSVSFKERPCFGNDQFIVRKTSPEAATITFVIASARFPGYFVCIDADGAARVTGDRAAAVVRLIRVDENGFTIHQNGVELKQPDGTTGLFRLRQIAYK